MNVLVTGASGFVGRHVCATLFRAGHRVHGAGRDPEPPSGLENLSEWICIKDFNSQFEWNRSLNDIDVVVHLAARVHVLDDRSSESVAEYRRVNVLGSESIARAAAARGVRRFIFGSSVKVNGESTGAGVGGAFRRFSEGDTPSPGDQYALSKWEAEQSIRRISTETGLEVVTLRPPLVYGPGVGANFLRLMQWIAAGRPLPFGSVNNLRSLIYVGNLADAVVHCLQIPIEGTRTYLVSDTDISTPDLIVEIARALGVKPHCFKVPPVLLRAAAAVSGQSASVSRLLDSLVLDSSRIRREADWTPPYSIAEGLAETAAWFRSRD